MGNGHQGGTLPPSEPDDGLDAVEQNEQPTGEIVYPSRPDADDDPSDASADRQVLAAEVEDARNRLLRNAADFDNYRKRMKRERRDLVLHANESLLRDILPVLDNLERAVGPSHTPRRDGDQLREGVQMVVHQFHALLDRCGVSRIDTHSRPFDPSLHEAMQQRVSANHKPGTIVEELQAGYKFHDRLLRPAIVVVAAQAPRGAPPSTRANAEEPVLIEVDGHYVDLSDLEAEFESDDFPGEDTEPVVERPDFFEAD